MFAPMSTKMPRPCGPTDGVLCCHMFTSSSHSLQRCRLLIVSLMRSFHGLTHKGRGKL